MHATNELTQGTQEWLNLRRTKITATDARVIMGVDPWKTKFELYNEKIEGYSHQEQNDHMKRGVELEPIARDLFSIQTGIKVNPRVVVKDWMMASLDGISECGQHLVEIKCPGEADHELAAKGKIPDHYYPQLQHQMHVCELDEMYYFSFHGIDGIAVKVYRNPMYVDKMLQEEWKFYQGMINRIPPEFSEKDFKDMSHDETWVEYANQWKAVNSQIKELEEKEKNLRNHLIRRSSACNSRGSGISLTKIHRKGNVDYSLIPELRNIDLEQYRKPGVESWRICLT